MVTQRIGFLDPLRGLAIIMVFAFHCVDLYSPVSLVEWHGLWRHWPDAPLGLLPLYAGWIGVPLFFVISGFCIQLSHQRLTDKGQGNWLIFYANRFFRLYPPYLAVFLLLWLMATLRHHSVNMTSVITHLGLLQNLWPQWMYDLNAALWSVAVEWQLYLIYPVMWLAAKWLGWRTCLTLAAGLEMAINAWPDLNSLGLWRQAPDYLIHSPFAYWFSWSLGAALANSYQQQTPLLTGKWHTPFWAGMVVLGLCFKPLYPLVFLYAAVLSGSIIANRLFKPVKPVKLGRMEPVGVGVFQSHLSWIGQISYSIYLLHLPVINVYPWLIRHIEGLQFLGHWSAFSVSLMLWPVILLTGWASYHWLEKPSISLGNWFKSRWLIPFIYRPQSLPYLADV